MSDSPTEPPEAGKPPADPTKQPTPPEKPPAISPDEPTRVTAASAAPSTLPEVYCQLAAELVDTADWSEPDADCGDCVMLPARLGATAHPWAFASDARCCTYHPELPNFLCGRALTRGDPGAALVRARLRDPSGVGAWGIRPSEGYRKRRQNSVERFGRDVQMRCPYWVGGDLACGIWNERNAVCRTWFCRHRDGLFGAVRWTARRRLLAHIELRVADYLARVCDPPQNDADPAAWEAFYRRCASRADRLDPRDLDAIADDQLTALRHRLSSGLQVLDSGLPEVVVPVIRGFEVVDGRLWVHGYSRYDLVSLPPSSIYFFAELSGRRDWRSALRRVRAGQSPGQSAAMTETLVRELYRIDILQSPSRVLDDAVDRGMDLPPRDPDAAIPEVLTPALGTPIRIGQNVWLQGSVPLGSIVAPAAIFRFLSRLDGTARWRDILQTMCAHREMSIDAGLVESLFRIGALQAA